ncbi:MAG: MFS transporter [Dehalococcoidia bacterium]
MRRPPGSFEYPIQPSLTGWRGATRSLRHRQFRWIYASNITFFFAMNGQMLVRSVLTFDLTGSALSLGLVNLAVAIPMLLVSPFGGVMSDRLERRMVIVAGQALLLAGEIVVFVLYVTGALEFWHLMGTAFFMGCVFPFVMPARSAIVANVVGRDGLANAMALQMGGMNAARVVGPVTAGFLIFLVEIRGAYLVAIILYTVALLAMTRIDRSPPDPDRPQRTVLGDLVDGVRYVAGDPPVRALMLLGIVPILLAMPFQSLLVVFAEDVWDVGSAGLGLLQAAAGLGGVAGSVYVAFHAETGRRARLMMASLLGFGGTLLLFALSPWFLLALPLVLIADVFASVFQTLNSTAIQVLIPDHVRGRVMSLMMMTFGLTPLGTLPVSAMAEAWGAPVAVGIACLATLVLAALFFAFSRSLRGIDRYCAEAIEQDRSGSGAPPTMTGGPPGAPSPAIPATP